VTRFDLSEYVLETRYTLGRNTGNTFQQTYTGATVQGVPVEGSAGLVRFGCAAVTLRSGGYVGGS
jgi:hypothetical protein